MVEHGIVSNRLFDVLAAGGVVVSDPVGGMHDLLGDIVPTVSDADQLADVVRRLLSDPDEGRQIARRGRDLVLRRTGNRQVIFTDRPLAVECVAEFLKQGPVFLVEAGDVSRGEVVAPVPDDALAQRGSGILVPFLSA